MPNSFVNGTVNYVSGEEAAATSQIEVKLDIRLCLPGEELMPNGECQICEPGTYLLIAPVDTELCKPCPESGDAECLGGNLFYPRSGFWRSSNNTENLYSCRNKDACM